MNDRIKELGLQAADWLENQDSINPIHAMQLYQEKFAELIVRECLYNMENCDGDLDFAIWKTKQDFGLKE